MDSQYHIIVQGKVQGVFFRDFTQRKANALGLLGTVRNKTDGSVEIFASGDKAVLKEFEEWCWQGSPYSNVTAVKVQKVPKSKEYFDFRVVY